MQPAPPPDADARRRQETMLILISLTGGLITVGVAIFDHDRLWHEGVMGPQ